MSRDISTAIPMLAVNDAKNAIEFYKNVFRADEVNRMVTIDGKIEHAEVKVGNAHIMIADEFPGHNRAAKSLGGKPGIIYLYVDNVDDVVERAVNSGSTSLRPIQDMPHGDRVGKIEDPFGHVWMVATPLK
ncbi:VOC family protein [Neobacillus ginsengisoli]|uniref:PhnB protein n=1 Tax=Neobacillus ginsengisoli TaxID=904295 RepID=A0ABT9Y1U3_9BACI|nr:VOC family protein [Neobacillus ginsengisoli]MDQ0201495.1 PhnB protein [Neobacillus ginsengisoli]